MQTSSHTKQAVTRHPQRVGRLHALLSSSMYKMCGISSSLCLLTQCLGFSWNDKPANNAPERQNKRLTNQEPYLKDLDLNGLHALAVLARLLQWATCVVLPLDQLLVLLVLEVDWFQ